LTGFDRAICKIRIDFEEKSLFFTRLLRIQEPRGQSVPLEIKKLDANVTASQVECISALKEGLVGLISVENYYMDIAAHRLFLDG
jgi:hypothetical protein